MLQVCSFVSEFLVLFFVGFVHRPGANDHFDIFQLPILKVGLCVRGVGPETASVFLLLLLACRKPEPKQAPGLENVPTGKPTGKQKPFLGCARHFDTTEGHGIGITPSKLAGLPHFFPFPEPAMQAFPSEHVGPLLGYPILVSGCGTGKC